MHQRNGQLEVMTILLEPGADVNWIHTDKNAGHNIISEGRFSRRHLQVRRILIVGGARVRNVN